MNFHDDLNRAIEALDMSNLDPRLSTDSQLRNVQHNTESMPALDRPVHKPLPVRSNLRRHQPAVNEQLELDDEDELGDELGDDELDDELGDDELDDELEDALGEPKQDQLDDGDTPAGIPSGSGYDLNMAKSQLDGIIEKWMDLAGNFPEGEKRHEFIEIGERLREISGVLHRDFLSDQEVI